MRINIQMMSPRLKFYHQHPKIMSPTSLSPFHFRLSNITLLRYEFHPFLSDWCSHHLKRNLSNKKIVPIDHSMISAPFALFENVHFYLFWPSIFTIDFNRPLWTHLVLDWNLSLRLTGWCLALIRSLFGRVITIGNIYAGKMAFWKVQSRKVLKQPVVGQLNSGKSQLYSHPQGT